MQRARLAILLLETLFPRSLNIVICAFCMARSAPSLKVTHSGKERYDHTSSKRSSRIMSPHQAPNLCSPLQSSPSLDRFSLASTFMFFLVTSTLQLDLTSTPGNLLRTLTLHRGYPAIRFQDHEMGTEDAKNDIVYQAEEQQAERCLNSTHEQSPDTEKQVKQSKTTSTTPHDMKTGIASLSTPAKVEMAKPAKTHSTAVTKNAKSKILPKVRPTYILDCKMLTKL